MPSHSATNHRLSETHWTCGRRRIPWDDRAGIEDQLVERAEGLGRPESGVKDLAAKGGVLWARYRTAVSVCGYPRYSEFDVRVPNGPTVMVWNAVVGYSEHSGGLRTGRLFFRAKELEGKGTCFFSGERAAMKLMLRAETFECEWEEVPWGEGKQTGWSRAGNSGEEAAIRIRTGSKYAELDGKQRKQEFCHGSVHLLTLYPDGKWTWNPLALLRRWFGDTCIFCEYEESFVRIFQEGNFAAMGALIAGMCGGTVLPRPVEAFGGPP